MGYKKSNSSYQRYKQYRTNRHTFKVEQIAFPIAMLILIGFITKFWTIVICLLVICIIQYLAKALNVYNDNPKVRLMRNENTQGEKNKVNENNYELIKTIDYGYINKNNQKNIGRTSSAGSDNNQWFYNMSCLHCSHTYYANGTDIWQRKCPNCQGGKG
jgi:hypothetical protein